MKCWKHSVKAFFDGILNNVENIFSCVSSITCSFKTRHIFLSCLKFFIVVMLMIKLCNSWEDFIGPNFRWEKILSAKFNHSKLMKCQQILFEIWNLWKLKLQWIAASILVSTSMQWTRQTRYRNWISWILWNFEWMSRWFQQLFQLSIKYWFQICLFILHWKIVGTDDW